MTTAASNPNPDDNLEQQQEQLEHLQLLQEYAAHYPVTVTWPPKLHNATTPTTTTTDRLKTTPQFVHQQLAHALGQSSLASSSSLPHDASSSSLSTVPPQSLQTLMVQLNHFVQAMEATTCYHSVHVELVPVSSSPTMTDQHPSQAQPQQNQEQQQQQAVEVHISLHEKNWYKLSAGASLNTNRSSSSSSSTNGMGSSWMNSTSGTGTSTSTNLWDGLGQAAEVEVSAGVRNIVGVGDTCEWAYTQQASTTAAAPSWTGRYQQPLFLPLPRIGWGLWDDDHDNDTTTTRIIPCHFSTKAFLTMVDFRDTRSYQEYQRGWHVQLASSSSTPLTLVTDDADDDNHDTTAAAVVVPRPPLQWSCLYQVLLRDLIPRLGPTTTPGIQSLSASWPILQQAALGPSWKQSLVWQLQQPPPPFQQEHAQQQEQVPYMDWTWSTEVALPDLLFVLGHAQDASNHANAFWKTQWHAAWHWPLLWSSSTTKNKTTTWLGTYHSLFQVGYLHSLALRHTPNNHHKESPPFYVSDRFFLGGPLPFRGFLPSGIGPRGYSSTPNASSSPQQEPQQEQPPERGDALGGDAYYTWTHMITFPLLSSSSSPNHNDTFVPLQAFVFGTVGTCVGSLSHVWNQQQPQQSSSSSSSRGPGPQPWFPRMMSQHPKQLVGTAQAVLQSSRCSVGCGMATTILGGGVRLEATYAVPLRYGPHDLRRTVQWALSLKLDQ